MKKGLSCIVTCFNSEKYIKKNILKLQKILNINKKKIEILAIDDFSKDNTFKILNLIKSKNIKIIRNKKNFGKSYSIIKALKKTKYDKVIFIDSDLPYLNNLKQVVRKLEKYDMVFVDRRHIKSKKFEPNKTIYQVSRELIGLFINFLIRLIFKIPFKDTQAGLKGFKKFPEFSKLQLYSNLFFLDVELISFFYKKKKKILNIPTNYIVPKQSSIKIISLKNILIFLEFIKIIIKK
jgi:glycosyltransferase involved in cell wall biosynthesis